jgi:two-component system, NarL family, nitrate/nitrite response regulator NarL
MRPEIVALSDDETPVMPERRARPQPTGEAHRAALRSTSMPFGRTMSDAGRASHLAHLLREAADRLDSGVIAVASLPEQRLTLQFIVDNVRYLVQPQFLEEDNLSPREHQIVGLVACGYTNHAIASELGISLWTVSTYMRRIFAKLNVRSRAAMVAAVVGIV